MADILPPGFTEVSVPLKHAALTRPAAVVFGVETPGGGVDPDALATSIQNSYATALGPRTDNQVTIGPVVVRIGQDGGEPVSGSAAAVVPGTGNFTAPTPQVAVLLRKRTARGGRRGRGRMFLPWAVAEGDLDEAGTIASATVNSINVAANTFLNTLAGNDYPMVILHSTGQTLPGSPNLVTSLTCDPVVATQRRRLRR